MSWADPVLLLTEHLPPYQIVEEQTVNGSSAEITKAVFEHANVDYEIAVFVWSDAYTIAQRNRNACLFSTSRIPEREAAFHWVGQINSMDTHFYRSVERDFSVNSLEDARKFRVAAIKDDVTHYYLLSKGFEINKNLYITHTYWSLVDMLDHDNRNIDMILLNPVLLEYRFADKRNLSRYKSIMQVQDLVLYHYLACNIDAEPKMIERLKASFTELEAAGELQAIRSQWGIKNMQAWEKRQNKLTNPSASLHHHAR